jgi:hypothetical protein
VRRSEWNVMPPMGAMPSFSSSPLAAVGRGRGVAPEARWVVLPVRVPSERQRVYVAGAPAVLLEAPPGEALG